MPPNPQRKNTDLREPRDSIAEIFGLPTGPWLDGFAAHGLAMFPYFDDPRDLSELPGPRRR